MASRRTGNAGEKTDTDLQPRRIPAQYRAERTVRHLLETAATLLEEVGLDHFNTNLLAKRAGVRIATVYRYFPNKLAILCTLFENSLELIVNETSFIEELSVPGNDWRSIIEAYLDRYVELVLAQKGHLAIRRAVLAAPELRKIEARLIRKLSVNFVEALQARGLQLASQQMYNFVEVFMTTTGQAIDLALIKAKKRKAFLAEIVAETKLLQTSYLANYLD